MNSNKTYYSCAELKRHFCCGAVDSAYSDERWVIGYSASTSRYHTAKLPILIQGLIEVMEAIWMTALSRMRLRWILSVK